MVNTTDFIERLEHLLQYYSLTASSFADKVNVQRSSISHLLSGRNKPSLEFVLKVVKAFPEVNLYWLLNGKGNFPAKNGKETPPSPAQEDMVAETEPVAQISPKLVIADSKRSIDSIVIFYSDGSFKAYTENSD